MFTIYHSKLKITALGLLFFSILTITGLHSPAVQAATPRECIDFRYSDEGAFGSYLSATNSCRQQIVVNYCVVSARGEKVTNSIIVRPGATVSQKVSFARSGAKYSLKACLVGSNCPRPQC